MKQINEYLLSKTSKKASTGFPDLPVHDDVVQFLKSNGFKEVRGRNIHPIHILEEQTERAYLHSNDYEYNPYKDSWVRFIDPAHEGEKQVFFCRLTEDGSSVTDDVAYIEYFKRSRDDIEFHDYLKFKKAVDNYFDW